MQRGRGLGSIFSALARGFAPVARLGLKAGKSFISSPIGKKLGESALEIAKQSAVNIGTDILKGNNIKKSAKKELEAAKKKIATTLRGGRKRKIDCSEEVKKTKKPKKVEGFKTKQTKKEKQKTKTHKKAKYSLLD